MPCLRLIHWNPGGTIDHVRRLREAGHVVNARPIRDSGDLPALTRRPPDVVLIDLDRLPMQRRDIGVWLRRRKATLGRTGLAAGLVDYKICAIDATWSGLLFALRTR